MTTSKSFTAAAICLASLFASTASHAQSSPWLVRVRALHIDPANKSDPIPSLAVPANAIHVKDRWVPELDDVPGSAVHDPRADDSLFDRADGYPSPIVDHAEERAEALRRYDVVRGR